MRALQFLSGLSFTLLAVSGLFIAPGVGRAQNVPIVRAGSFEVGPFLGATVGIDSARVLGGGNITYAINKHILPYFEYSYFPGFTRSVTSGPVVATLKIPIQDIHGGVHIRIPIRESPIVPYGVFGVGALRYPAKTGTFSTLAGVDLGVKATFVASTAAAVNFGGGVRYYFGQRWGARLEAKAYKPVNGPYPGVFGKVEVGVFYQFR